MMSEDGRLWGGTAWSRREPTPDPAIRSLERLDASSLSERVYAQLRAALMRGELVPEQRLKIGEVAERLGTSETPVREAVFQLNRSEEHTSELQSLMRISYAVFCLKKKNTYNAT